MHQLTLHLMVMRVCMFQMMLDVNTTACWRIRAMPFISSSSSILMVMQTLTKATGSFASWLIRTTRWFTLWCLRVSSFVSILRHVRQNCSWSVWVRMVLRIVVQMLSVLSALHSLTVCLSLSVMHTRFGMLTLTSCQTRTLWLTQVNHTQVFLLSVQ